MSEQKQTFMQQLDEWTTATVINPLHEAITEGDGEDCDATVEAIKQAIRDKVYTSYKNGLAAGPKGSKPVKKPAAQRPAGTSHA